MKTQLKLVSTLFALGLLCSCGGTSNENSKSIKIEDMEIKGNEITSTDGTKGFKGDVDNTDLQTMYEGLTFDKVVLIDGDDRRINGAEVPFDSKFSVVFEGIKSYTLVDGKAFPKLSIMVTGETGLVVDEKDLLASSANGLSPADAAVLRGTVVVGEPMVKGKMYVCAIRIADRNKTDAYIESTWMFTVK